MKRVSLLHVGDVHYPEAVTLLDVDLGDEGFSRDLLASIAPQRLKRAMDAVIHIVETTPDLKGILFSGDLTSLADQAGYEKCVGYLEQNLKDTAVWGEEPISVVPGNHDVDRNADVSSDPMARFRPSQRTWDARSLPVFAPDRVRTVRIGDDSAALHIHSINSCVGCGEKRWLPSVVRNQISEILAAYLNPPLSKQAFDIVGEQLDTPAFLGADLDRLESLIADAHDGVHVVLGHHSVLPQAMTRLALYTEVVNGGRVRTQLAQAKPPVIYCHGHVHDDPIEVVRDPECGEAAFVSAPRFVDGFNLLHFLFATNELEPDSNNIPLGLEVIRFKPRRTASFKPDSPVRIPFCSPKTFDRIAQNDHHAILSVLTVQPQRAIPLFELAALRIPGLQRSGFFDRLRELFWHGLIDIQALDEAEYDWQVRRFVA